MKTLLATLALFALAITALHAQIPVEVPGVDPAIQAAVNAAVPAHWSGYTSLAILALMILGRWVKAVQNGTGIKGWFSAIWSGTNTPHILIACLALLTLPSCQTFKKLTAALSTPQAKQTELALAELGLHIAVNAGKLSAGDALSIGNGVAVLTSGDTTISKVVQLSSIGLDTAATKGLIKPGDSVLIKATTAVITQALAPTPLTPAPAPANTFHLTTQPLSPTATLGTAPAIVGPLP